MTEYIGPGIKISESVSTLEGGTRAGRLTGLVNAARTAGNGGGNVKRDGSGRSHTGNPR